MEILYLGHAGFRVTNHRGKHLLIDPWLSPTGAFLNSWFQFPENHFLSEQILPFSPDDGMVYISHHHRDHFDPDFLKRLDPSTPLLVPRFVRKHFIQELKGLGFQNIHQLNHLDSLEWEGFKLTLFIDESYSNEDSGILVETEGRRFLNMNDCRAYDGPEFDRLGQVDIMTIQFSGASWFPSTYNYSEEQRNLLSQKKNRKKFANVLHLIQRIQPKMYLPSAGPACFLDPELFAFNLGDPPPFPDASEFIPQVRKLNIEAPYIFPGDRVVLPDDGPPCLESGGYFSPHLYENKMAYLKDYARRRANQARLPEGGKDWFPHLKKVLGDKAGALRKPLPVSHKIIVSVVHRPGLPDSHVQVDLGVKEVKEVADLPPPPFYHFTFTNRMLNAFFSTGALWDELMLSLRFRVERDPDQFDTQIMDFMRLEVNDLYGYPRPRPCGRLTLSLENRCYEFDRYCPHQGADLQQARIQNGILVCPRHGWRFDLEGGGVSEETRSSIHCIRIDSPNSSNGNNP